MAPKIEERGLPHRYVCEKCGKIVYPEDYKHYTDWKDLILNRPLCFECGYWINLIEFPVKHRQIINHQYFSLPPEVEKGEDIHYVLTLEGDLLESSKLFNYGSIPERFWSELPDTASFVSYARARTIKARQGYECDRMGCWDRTHCLWYQGQMDWNEIPPKHKPGAENCPMFIDKFNPMK